MSHDVDVCLVTTGHPSTNPRLVKELRALVDHRYRVHVVACKFARWADAADAEFMSLPCRWTWVRFGACANPVLRQWRRIAHYVARRIVGRQVALERCSDSFLHRAQHVAASGLTREATKVKARLYIAHNLGALPAAFRAAKIHNAMLGFDAEDYHRGEFEVGDVKSITQRIIERIEERFIPKCDFVTAASDPIAAAYHKDLGLSRPKTILNVFPLQDREVVLSSDEIEFEKPAGKRSLYWFSQTIGRGRGLESILRSLPYLPPDVIFSVRGNWSPGFRDEFMKIAAESGVESRIRALKPTAPGELIARAACHDIGLAVEPGTTPNNNKLVSNKIFTYLAAGVPCLISDTEGQRGIGEQLPLASRIVSLRDPRKIADAACSLFDDYLVARNAAQEGGKVFCWENESQKFLAIYQQALNRIVDNRRENGSNSPGTCAMSSRSVDRTQTEPS